MDTCYGLFLLVTVLSQALFTLVRGHFVFFSLLTAWHIEIGFCKTWCPVSIPGPRPN